MKTFRKFAKRKIAFAGLLVVMLNILLALLGLVWTPHDPNLTNGRNLLKPPSAVHWFGTDELGRDVLSRIISGAGITIAVGIVAVLIAMVAGTALGLISGYFGKKVDAVIGLVVEAIWAFPSLILALAITSVLGPGVGNVMLALGIVSIPAFARIVRSMVLSIRESEYVEGAVAIGLNSFEIIYRHILPNVMPVIIVQTSLSAATAIISEASLSFLGLGIVPPEATWGAMIKTGYPYLTRAPWLSVYPGVFILVMVLSLNFMGDGLRDALDVRLRAD